jgi:Bcr/CflA subfamily drug resistance transporter
MTDIRPPPAAVPWRLVLLLGALTAFAPMSIDMYLSSLPSIGRTLHAGPDQTQATLAAFFAGMAIGQMIYGPASDRFGRRPPLLIGIVVFFVASVVCALAPNIETLIAARFVQALGGCAGPVIARAVVRDRFSHADTARVLSLMTLIMGLAPVLAPQLGGVVQFIAGWRGVFWTLVGFGALIGLWVTSAFPSPARPRPRPTPARENPLKAYVALFGMRRLMGYALAGALNGAVLFTYISGAPDLVMGTYGHTPLVFNLIFAFNAVGIIGASQVNRLLLRRHRLPDAGAEQGQHRLDRRGLPADPRGLDRLGRPVDRAAAAVRGAVAVRPDGRQHHGGGAQRRSAPGRLDLGPDGLGLVRGRRHGLVGRRPAARRYAASGGRRDVRLPGRLGARDLLPGAAGGEEGQA